MRAISATVPRTCVARCRTGTANYAKTRWKHTKRLPRCKNNLPNMQQMQRCQKHATHAATWANHVPQIAKMGPKMVPKRPRWTPTCTQNDQDGLPNGVKMARRGPRWPRGRPERGQVGHKGENGREKTTPKWAQTVQNRTKNVLKMVMVYKALSASIWDPFFVQNEIKMEAQIVAKTGCYQKGAFSLPYSKNQGFLMNLRVWGFHFWS